MNHNTSFTIPSLRLLSGVGVLLAIFLGWAATDRAAQDQEPDKKQPDKKRVEEEEDKPAKPPMRKIRVEEEDPNAKPSRPGAGAAVDLAQLARQSKYGAVQNLMRKLAVPFDLVTQRDPNNPDRALPTVRVEPVERFYGSDRTKLFGMIQVTELDGDNKPQAQTVANGMVIKSIQPYELVALDELDRFRKAKEDAYKDQPPLYERLLAEEQVLSAVLRFHGSAKETGRRKGDDWKGIETRLQDELIKVLLKQLTELTTGQEWDAAFALAMRLADSFPGEGDQQVIAPKILELVRQALAANRAKLSINDDHLRGMYERLRGLIERYPANQQIQGIGRNLKEQAQKLFDRAKEIGASNKKDDLAKAQDLLRQAEEIWPALEGLQKLRQDTRLKYPILRVGIRQPLPAYKSPNTAVTDAELRAVELQFESLVKFSPDAEGIGRYQPGLAEGRPVVIDLGREFRSPSNALWSNGRPIEIGDLRATFRAVKEGRGPGNSLAWQNLFADTVVSPAGSFRFRVNLNKGSLEPLSLMTQKIVPAFALRPEQEDDFGKKPIGSGPFLFDDKIRSENGRACAGFVRNPHFGARAGKLGQPYLNEVRFFQYTNAFDEVKKQPALLDVLLDLTAEEANGLKEQNFKVILPNPKQINHRVYFLAVNHRKTPLDDENVRVALALAIDREKLLDNHYRGPLGKDIHKAINSPYPANCWAANPKLHSRADKNSCDPFDPARATARLKAAIDAKKVRPGELKLQLKHPDDPALAKAMTELAAQVQEVLNVTIEPVAVDARTLQNDVERVFNYDLAYYYYDFPDDTFWLGPLFGPRLRGDEAIDNIFGYKSHQDEFPDLLRKSIDYREFAEVQKYTRQLHFVLTQEMPVIPLWQLDPLNALHEEVKTPVFDPQRVFTDIEKWQLDRVVTPR